MINELLNLQDKVDSFWLNGINVLFVMFIFGGIFLSTILMPSEDKEKDAKIKKITLISSIIFWGLLLVTTFLIKDHFQKELIALESEYFDSLKEDVIDTGVILHMEETEKSHCPHVEIESGTKCFFIKVADADGIKQLFIPSNYAQLEKHNANVKIPYYDLSKEDREFLVEYLWLDNPRIKNEYNIDLDNWLLGFSPID